VEVKVKRFFQSLYQFIPTSLFLTSFVLLAACSSGGETTQPPAQQPPTQAPAPAEATTSTTESEPAAPTQAPQSNNEPAANQNSDEASSTTAATELTVVPVAATVESNKAPIRIQFPAGGTSGSASGTIGQGQVHQYLLGAQAKQNMSVGFTPDANGNALLAIQGADGQTLTENVLGADVTLPTTQDYIVSVIGQSDTPFDYEVVITISALPFVPSVENIGYADRAAWLQFLNVPASCEEEFQFIADYYQEQNLSGITFYTVEPQKYVVEVLCATFAYSFHSRLYLYNAQTQSATPLILQDVTPDGTLQNTDILFTSGFGFDNATNHFTNFQKGRGIGDCGALYTYQFASDSLTLLEARYRECSETISEEDYVEPQEWDVIYP